jgi:c-di-GMP-binding flagellar brake protein YcgR
MGLFGKTKTSATSVQQRDHVRIESPTRVDLRKGGFSTSTQILDLSETGMRCSVAHSFPVGVGSQIRVMFTLGSQEMELTAQVVRQVPESQFLQDIGLAFLFNDSRDQEQLRRYILERQFEHRRAER